MKNNLLTFQKFIFASLIGIFILSSCSNDNETPELPPDETNYAGLVLNEICGLQEPDDDWIEIFNTTDKAIDISGVQIIKTDENGDKKTIYTVPENTTITAKGYKVAATLSGELSAGISNSKQIGITLVKPDGVTAIDKFDRNTNIGTDKSHASGGSYARIPNGSGNWAIVKTSTRGTLNVPDEQTGDIDYSGLVLNEICGLQSPDDDWIEILNTSGEDINISGIQIIKTDEKGEEKSIYTAPEGTYIGSGSYRVIATLTEELTAGISNNKQVGISLVEPDGETTIDVFDRNEEIGVDSGHALGGSYARLPNGTGDWEITYQATRGTENVKGEAPPTVDYTGLTLNEICGLQSPDDDWIEILNTTNKSIDISGVQIIKTDEKNTKKTIFTFPAESSIAAGEYKIIATLTGELSAGISNSKQVGITLASPTGDYIDDFDRDNDIAVNESHLENGSYARIPDATGNWAVVKTATRGTANKADAGDPTPDVDYTGLVLNEVNGNGTKYVELYNNSDNTIDISGVVIKKNGSTLHTIPDGVTIGSKSFKTFVSGKDGGADFSGGISAKKSLLIELTKPDGKTILDAFKNLNNDETETWDTSTPKYNGETNNESYGRHPNGTGSWYMMPITQNTSNSEGTTKIEW